MCQSLTVPDGPAILRPQSCRDQRASVISKAHFIDTPLSRASPPTARKAGACQMQGPINKFAREARLKTKTASVVHDVFSPCFNWLRWTFAVGCGVCSARGSRLGSTGSRARRASTCVNGACGVGSCEAKRANCNDNATDGCETNVEASHLHCGSCNNAACGEDLICSDGTCASSCAAGRTACAGGCVDLATDSSHCGECDKACPVPANGVGTCEARACGVKCNAGYHLCGGVCNAEAIGESFVTDVWLARCIARDTFSTTTAGNYMLID